MKSTTRWRTGLAIVAAAAGVMTFLLLSTLFPRADNRPVPAPDVTGSYSTVNLLPEKCHHTGPGWVTEPSELTDGVSFRVRDLYYCDNLTGGVITPGTGDRFNIYVPVTFSKTKPKEGS